jgi:hypothetical protein
MDTIENLLGTVENGPTDADRAEAALTLAREAERLEGLLLRAKTALRGLAVERLNAQPGMIVLNATQGGSVAVTLPRPSLRVVAQRDALQGSLGPLYGLLFEERVTVAPRADFRDLVSNVTDEAAKRTLLAAVEEVEGTPRVSFRFPGNS